MSKSLKNYPDPIGLIDSTGADALRAYLINSPVVRAEPLRFSERGVSEVVRTVMLPYWNAFSFFTTYAAAEGITASDLVAAPPPAARPEIDRWILSVLQSLVRRVNEEMEGYYLYNVIPPLIEFVDHLTNWYIRRSRRRFWTSRAEGGDDALAAFATLYEVLVTFAKLMAPVLPFVTEAMYQDLVVAQREGSGGPSSVHHEDYPQADPDLIDTRLEIAMAAVRRVVGLGRGLRVAEGIRTRQPLARLMVVSHEPEIRQAIEDHAALLCEELNVHVAVASDDELALADLSAKPNYRTLGPRFGGAMPMIATAIARLSSDEVAQALRTGSVTVGGETVTAADLMVNRAPRAGLVVAADEQLAVALDTEITPDLALEGTAREIVKLVQAARRDAGLDLSDRVVVRWSSPSSHVAEAMARHTAWIAGEVLAVALEQGAVGDPSDAAGEPVTITVTKAG